MRVRYSGFMSSMIEVPQKSLVGLMMRDNRGRNVGYGADDCYVKISRISD